MRGARDWLLLGVVLLCMGADSVGASPDTGTLGLLREFGFPIFVSLWFMWRVEKKIDRFTETIQVLLTAITVMAKTVDGLPSATARAQTNNQLHSG